MAEKKQKLDKKDCSLHKEKEHKSICKIILDYLHIITSILVFIIGVAWVIKMFFFAPEIPNREQVISFSIILFVLNCLITGANIITVLKVMKGNNSEDNEKK